MGDDHPTLMSQVIVQFIHYLMEQSNQPKKATPEQNANVAEQVKRIVVDRILEEKVQEKLQSPENQLRIEMMAVYRQLTENTNYTRDASKNVLDELVKLTDLVLLYKSRLEQVERERPSYSTINRKLDILNKASKGHAERLNKLEKLK